MILLQLTKTSNKKKYQYLNKKKNDSLSFFQGGGKGIIFSPLKNI